MNGKHQVSRTVEVAADPAAIWSVIADSTLLPQWASVVKDVAYLGEGEEGVGMTRHCNVELGGRTGTMTERCVEFIPTRRAGYVVDDDTLGFQRMLVDYGFTITLDPVAVRATVLRIDTYYTPRNPLYAMLNRLVLRRRMRTVVDGPSRISRISAALSVPGTGCMVQSTIEHTRSPSANWWRTRKLVTAAPAWRAMAR